MNNTELISVIIPIYNVEQYLKQCIDSVVAQTYKNLEIILIDDGSTDNSGKICDDYALKDNRIKVIHKENRGVSVARNAGLNIARGDYIGFVDSDDYIELDMYEELYNIAVQTKTKLVVCNYFRGNNNNWTENKIFPHKQILTIKEAYEELYKCENVYTKLFSKSIIEDISFNENIAFGEDRLFYMEAYKKIDKIGCLPIAKYYYRITPNSATTCCRFKKNFLGFIDVLNVEMEYAEKNNLINLKNFLYKIQISIAIKWLIFISKETKPDVESAKDLLKLIRKNFFTILKSKYKFGKKCFALISCINFKLASLIYRLFLKLKIIK